MLRTLIFVTMIITIGECAIFFLFSNYMGSGRTLLIIIITSFLGVILVKRESRKVWRYARSQWSEGILPTPAIVKGISLFVAGILFIVPGLLTDIVALTLLIPITRNVYISLLGIFLNKKITTSRFKRL